MNCSKCGEVCRCIVESPRDALNSDQAAVQLASAQPPFQTQNGAADPDAWRDEISARLSRYRARRRSLPPRYPSLRLPFEKAASVPERTIPPESFPASNLQTNSSYALARDDPAPEAVIEPTVEVQPVRAGAPVAAPTAKIIQFPRFAWAPPPPPPDQLAEPVGEQLRILEVPEFQPPPPALGGITIAPAQAESVEKRLGIDIPLQIAPLGRRLAASAIDGLIIAAASALSGLIFWKVTAVRPPDIQLLSLAAGTLTAFWGLYQYLLIVYSGSTPGLRAAGLELARFDGSSTTRSLRRWRILASYLSALSLGMGYAWVFLDEDSLCWHDRITRTHFGLKKKEGGKGQSSIG